MFYSILNSKNKTNDLKIYPNFKCLNCTKKIPVFCCTENLRINKKIRVTSFEVNIMQICLMLHVFLKYEIKKDSVM